MMRNQSPLIHSKPQVDILLATYNGAKYLEPLMQSLREQTYTNFRVLARDDGSTDTTLEILKKYGCEIVDSHERKGPVQSFAALMAASTAPYVMFCDQDDLWYRTKIETCLKAIAGNRRPALVHTDLRLVDQDGNHLAPSFWKFAYLTPMTANSWNRLVLQNNVTGCTVMMNRALVDLALPIPAQAMMHDWWVAIVASAFGNVIALPEATIDYRQHGNNTLGAQQFQIWANLKAKLMKLRKPDPRKREQFLAFYRQYENRLPSDKREMIEAYLAMPHVSFLENRYLAMKYGFYPNGWIRIGASLFKRCF